MAAQPKPSIDPRSIPQEPKHRAAWIKYQLELRGITLADLARQHGVTRQQPQAALTRSYPKWERILADTLGLRPSDLFKERYSHE